MLRSAASRPSLQAPLGRFLPLEQAWPAQCPARTPNSSAAGMPGRLRPRGRIGSSWEHLGLKTGAPSRCHAEPRMNEAGLAAFSGSRYFGATMLAPLSRAVAALGWGPSDRQALRRPGNDHSSKIIGRDCGIGFCRAWGDVATAARATADTTV